MICDPYRHKSVIPWRVVEVKLTKSDAETPWSWADGLVSGAAPSVLWLFQSVRHDMQADSLQRSQQAPR
jgi:hypothetical protein